MKVNEREEGVVNNTLVQCFVALYLQHKFLQDYVSAKRDLIHFFQDFIFLDILEV